MGANVKRLDNFCGQIQMDLKHYVIVLFPEHPLAVFRHFGQASRSTKARPNKRVAGQPAPIAYAVSLSLSHTLKVKRELVLKTTF